MAILKLGPIVVGVRGTIGGITFSENRSGPYAKNWAAGPKSRSSLQTEQRNKLLAAPGGWRYLTDEQKEEWDYWASEGPQQKTNPLGETYFLSGYQAYMNLALWGMTVGREAEEYPPVLGKPDPPTVDAITCESGPEGIMATIEYPSYEYLDDEAQLIFTSIGRTEGSQFKTSGFKLTTARAVVTGTNYDMSEDLEQNYGRLQSGSTLFFRVFRQSIENVRSDFTPVRVIVN